jgi:hypothetical protein
MLFGFLNMVSILSLWMIKLREIYLCKDMCIFHNFMIF